MGQKKFSTIIIPSFQSQLDSFPKDHQRLILKKFEKVERSGKNVLKVLRVVGEYLLTEIRVNRPPYRLYVIINQQTDTFYFVAWEHKDRQRKVIEQLSEKLHEALRLGLKPMIEGF